jgi:hypothetical protein
LCYFIEKWGRKSLADVSKVKFTRHASQKFDFLKKYSFKIGKEQVIDAVLRSDHLDKRDDQFFAVKVLDSDYALRVVYEKRKGFLVVITFYPVRRERYGL